SVGGSGRDRRRADGDRLSLVAFRRRDLRINRVCCGGAWRVWQRAWRAHCRPDHWINPGAVSVLVRTDLQRHCGLWAVRRVAVVAPSGPDGQSVKKILTPTVLLAAALLIYPLVFSGAFYLDVGVTFLLAAISASAWNIVGGYAGQVSVGHAMFFGIGAYVPLLFYQLWGWPPVAGVPAGIIVSPLLAVAIGL